MNCPGPWPGLVYLTLRSVVFEAIHDALHGVAIGTKLIPGRHTCACRLSNLNVMWYSWGAVMITIFKGTDAVGANGQPILDYYSLPEDLMWAYIGYTSLYFAVFLLLAWLALSFLRHQKR